MITTQRKLIYQSKIMISPAQVKLQNIVTNYIFCSLLILPSLASAQEIQGTPNQGSGLRVESAVEPTAQEPTVVTLPGAIPEVGSSTKSAAGSSTLSAAGSSTKSPDGSSTKASDGLVSVADGEATSDAGGESEGERTLEERRAAWMAELKQLTFSELVKRIRKDEQKINQLYINVPLGNPTQQKEFENAIASLQGEVVVLNELCEPAAIEAFRQNPNGSQAITNKVFEVLASKLAPRGRASKYDPKEGLRLVDTILEIKGGDIGMEPGVSPLPEDEPFIRVVFQGYLASFGLEDFKRAEEFLVRLENMEIGLDPKVRELFEATVEDWTKEEALRAEEARVDSLPRVKLETTDGDVLIELFENEAPNTVANFIKLTEEGYYDGLEFFQVVPSNYARSGCKANDGTTHPGYRIRNEFENARSHFAGTVVMQNDGENTAGSQFIILHRPDTNLKGKVVAFGRVIEGLENVYGFKAVNRIRNAGGEATIINKATVVRGPTSEHELEMIDDGVGSMFDDPSKVLPSGLPSQSSPGSTSRSLPGVYSPTTLPPNGSSTRSLVPSGVSTRASKSRGSSKRSAIPIGSSKRPSASPGTVRPSTSRGSSSRPSSSGGSYSRPSSTSGSYSRPSR